MSSAVDTVVAANPPANEAKSRKSRATATKATQPKKSASAPKKPKSSPSHPPFFNVIFFLSLRLDWFFFFNLIVI